ncbi:MAG: cytochrome b [Motiliproteus sp.]
MQIRNSKQSYGSLTKSLHWLLALAIVGLFALGLWMRELGYYDSWYQTAPYIHQSVGILVMLFMLFRMLWRLSTPLPTAITSQARWEHISAHITHWILYLLVFVICVSGYLINADERTVPLFDWLELPPLLLNLDDQEELMGELHFYSAWAIILLAGVHALAALKHHFVDRDETLKRML